MICVFEEAPGRKRVMPTPGLLAPIVVAGTPPPTRAEPIQTGTARMQLLRGQSLIFRAQYMTTTTKIENNLRCDLLQFWFGEKPVAPLPPATANGLPPSRRKRPTANGLLRAVA
eukprot:9468103-Pyramimonas_sp.AAC.1